MGINQQTFPLSFLQQYKYYSVSIAFVAKRKISSIQLSEPAKLKLKRKKREYETYEEYLRRIGVV